MNIRIYQLACYCMLLVSLSTLYAQSRKQHKPQLSFDPVFGIYYDRFTVRYEKVPATIDRLCPLSNNSDRFGGVFAHIASGNSEYFVIKNTIPVDDEYGWATVILINGDKCIISSTDWMFNVVPSTTGYKESGVVERLPRPSDPDATDNSDPSNGRTVLRFAHEEAVIRGLVRDAIQRCIKAYGGEAPFRNKVCSTVVIENTFDFPIVQQELKAYCSKAPER